MGNLKSHMFNHTGDKPYQCSFEGCAKKYSRMCRLRIHQRTHTGCKPFKCPFPKCCKVFNEKGNLKTHYRIHTGEKPYICSYAGCNQSFKAHGHLKDHFKRHLNIRPYECKICSAKFARTSTLKIHSHTHMENRSYFCPNLGCLKKFSEKGNMKTHMKTHEKREIEMAQAMKNNDGSGNEKEKEKDKHDFDNANMLDFSNYYKKAKEILNTNKESCSISEDACEIPSNPQGVNSEFPFESLCRIGIFLDLAKYATEELERHLYEYNITLICLYTQFSILLGQR